MDGTDWSAYKCCLLVRCSQLGQSDLVRARFICCSGKVTVHKKAVKVTSALGPLLVRHLFLALNMHDNKLGLQKGVFSEGKTHKLCPCILPHLLYRLKKKKKSKKCINIYRRQRTPVTVFYSEQFFKSYL